MRTGVSTVTAAEPVCDRIIADDVTDKYMAGQVALHDVTKDFFGRYE